MTYSMKHGDRNHLQRVRIIDHERNADYWERAAAKTTDLQMKTSFEELAANERRQADRIRERVKALKDRPGAKQSVAGENDPLDSA